MQVSAKWVDLLNPHILPIVDFEEIPLQPIPPVAGIIGGKVQDFPLQKSTLNVEILNSVASIAFEQIYHN